MPSEGYSDPSEPGVPIEFTEGLCPSDTSNDIFDEGTEDGPEKNEKLWNIILSLLVSMIFITIEPISELRKILPWRILHAYQSKNALNMKVPLLLPLTLTSPSTLVAAGTDKIGAGDDTALAQDVAGLVALRLTLTSGFCATAKSRTGVIGATDSIGVEEYLSSPHTYFGCTPLCIVTDTQG